MLCRECKHMKEKPISKISAVFYCNVSKGVGVHPWIEKVHPKCPLRINKKKEGR